MNEETKKVIRKKIGRAIRMLCDLMEDDLEPNCYDIFKNKFEALENSLYLANYNIEGISNIIQSERKIYESNQTKQIDGKKLEGKTIC